ncbi:MAG: hypothetical protein ACKOKG_13610 [Verrucomicrobiota bacterium]
MPLTALQKDVLAILGALRSEESHFAGGIVLNAGDDSPRFSNDFDLFHELAEEVTRASERDVQCLRHGGFHVETCSPSGEWDKECSFRKARVIRGAEWVEIDWAADSAFRFFPIERDPVLGWRLHRFDVATNKALALSARTETRDYVDIVEIHRTFPLAAICWAACGKDPGFTPLSLLKMMKRFARIDRGRLEEIQARALDPVKLKEAWIGISDQAEVQMTRLADESPDLPIGVAFVDDAGCPGWVGDNPALRPHAPTPRGCWPRIHGLEP